MKRVKEHSKTIQIMSFTLIVLGIINFSAYPTSYTKFMIRENEILKYNSNIISLETENNAPMNLISIDANEAILEFSLSKNTADLGVVEKDVYNLILPDECSTAKNEITFSDTNPFNVRITCNLTEGNLIKSETSEDAISKQYLDISVQINESINDEIPFRYKEYNYHEEYHITNTSNEVKNTNSKISNSDLQTMIINSLITKDKYKKYNKEISSYIKTAEITDSSFNLLGIKLNYQEDTNQYTYQEDENFLGYARTYYENNENNNSGVMVFTTMDTTQIEDIFTYYLNKYYSFTSNEISLIKNYIKSKNDIGTIILNQETIDGITYPSEEFIKIEPNIMDCIYTSVTDNEFFIYHDNYEHMLSVFMASLDIFSNITQNLKEKITIREDILASITQTNTLSPQKAYFLIKDETNCLLIEISTSTIHNKIKIIPIEIQNETDDFINFNLVYSNNDNLTDDELILLMNTIMEEFNENIIKESFTKTEENKNTHISFKIKKEKETENSTTSNSNNLSDNSIENYNNNLNEPIPANDNLEQNNSDIQFIINNGV